MATAFDGLEERLRDLANIILKRAETDSKNAGKALSDADGIYWRNKKLIDFREQALNVDFEPDNDGAPEARLTARIFSYIHNEFNFNAPRPLARCARVSHLVFAPLFTEKTSKETDPFKRLN